MVQISDAQKKVLHSLQHLIEPDEQKFLVSTADVAARAGLDGDFTRNALNRLCNKGLVCQPSKGDWGLTVDGGQYGTS
nr:hypothetical protein [uncultured Cohaesibacter sp.]